MNFAALLAAVRTRLSRRPTLTAQGSSSRLILPPDPGRSLAMGRIRGVAVSFRRSVNMWPKAFVQHKRIA